MTEPYSREGLRAWGQEGKRPETDLDDFCSYVTFQAHITYTTEFIGPISLCMWVTPVTLKYGTPRGKGWQLVMPGRLLCTASQHKRELRTQERHPLEPTAVEAGDSTEFRIRSPLMGPGEGSWVTEVPSLLPLPRSGRSQKHTMETF